MIDNGICMDCGHRHRGIAQCNFCECIWETIVLVEDNMFKKFWKKIKSWFWIKD